MFKEAKVGDKVWDFTKGWTEIKCIDNHSLWPIRTTNGYIYTLEGETELNDLHPTLFWDEIKFEIPKKPLPKLEVDTKVIVWNGDDSSNKFKRYFSHFNEDGRIAVFINGTTSWSNRDGTTSWSNRDGYVSSYNNWELYDETKD